MKSNYSLFALKNSLILHDEEENLFKVFNTTDILNEDHSNEEGFDLKFHKSSISNFSKIIYSFQKNNIHSTFIASIESNLKQNKSEFHLYEIINQHKQSNDFFSNLRFPV